MSKTKGAAAYFQECSRQGQGMKDTLLDVLGAGFAGMARPVRLNLTTDAKVYGCGMWTGRGTVLVIADAGYQPGEEIRYDAERYDLLEYPAAQIAEVEWVQW